MDNLYFDWKFHLLALTEDTVYAFVTNRKEFFHLMDYLDYDCDLSNETPFWQWNIKTARMEKPDIEVCRKVAELALKFRCGREMAEYLKNYFSELEQI